MNINFHIKWIILLSVFTIICSDPLPLYAKDDTLNSLVSVDNPLNEIKKESPLVYVISIGLVLAVISLSGVIKILWDKNNVLYKDKDDLQETKLKIAISTTETMREAIYLVKEIHKEIYKLSDDDVGRKITEEHIKTALASMQTELKTLSDEVRRAIR